MLLRVKTENLNFDKLKLNLKLSSFNRDLLNEFYYSLNNLRSIYSEDITKLNRVFLPCKIKKFCVLRSPFKHKDAREQFEIRFYKQILLLECTSLFINKLLLIDFPFGIELNLTIL